MDKMALLQISLDTNSCASAQTDLPAGLPLTQIHCCALLSLAHCQIITCCCCCRAVCGCARIFLSNRLQIEYTRGLTAWCKICSQAENYVFFPVGQWEHQWENKKIELFFTFLCWSSVRMLSHYSGTVLTEHIKPFLCLVVKQNTQLSIASANLFTF